MDVFAVLARLAAGVKRLAERAEQCRVGQRVRLPAAQQALQACHMLACAKLPKVPAGAALARASCLVSV